MSAFLGPVAVGGLALDNNLVLAPMAGYSQRAQRVLARHYGASLAVTEMISAYEILRPGRKTRRLLEIVDQDRPLGVQVFGTDPAMMAEAAARVEAMGCFDLLDVNLACPVRKMLAKGNGGAMLKNPQAALKVLEAMRGATRLPLAIKVRRGFDGSADSRRRVDELLAGAQTVGIDAVTIHGRTVDQLYHGQADWAVIDQMACRLKVPVFGSGDLTSAAAIVTRLRETCVAGVAVARGAVGRPWIFREVLQLAAGRGIEPVSRSQRVQCMWRHYEMLCDELGQYTAIRIMRRFGIFYSKGLDRARDARVVMSKVGSRDELAEVIKEFFE
ncbi:MAG: tRNA dihydrouridine synthase DusB [Anaerolineaceae bacterium]|nr:tRNA dihydrouridine synthase DusB [Anaerolineaceae bacterium]